jgi:uncharacterized protein (TIGR03083 family)
MVRFREALRLLRIESEALCAELAALAPGDWDLATNCDPWTVRLLVAHLVRGAESYLMGLERGLEGVLEPALSREQRTQRMHEIAAWKPTEILSELRAITDRFEAELGSLRPDQLDILGYHSYGPRPARWFAEQRLAEVAFHRWDVLHSLGRPADLDALTAAFLLPMLLEKNLPEMMERGGLPGGASFKLAVRGDANSAWHVAAARGSTTVTRDREADGDVVIEGEPAALALLVYGRSRLQRLQETGRVSVAGDQGLAQRFHELFRGP